MAVPRISKLDGFRTQETHIMPAGSRSLQHLPPAARALGASKLISRVAELAGGLVQAAGWYSLMSPAQVVCRWIGWPGLIG